jgi:DNA-directed RNA polymerase subunit M/transcription elongation factor TFIIS
MPKYTFLCRKCKKIIQQYAAIKTEIISCPECHDIMLRQMPTISSTQIEETVNKETNIRWKKDQKEIIEERKLDYYWTYVVPRLVETHELQTILENEWGYIDDNGNLQIYDKPPHKR